MDLVCFASQVQMWFVSAYASLSFPGISNTPYPDSIFLCSFPTENPFQFINERTDRGPASLCSRSTTYDRRRLTHSLTHSANFETRTKLDRIEAMEVAVLTAELADAQGSITKVLSAVGGLQTQGSLQGVSVATINSSIVLTVGGPATVVPIQTLTPDSNMQISATKTRVYTLSLASDGPVLYRYTQSWSSLDAIASDSTSTTEFSPSDATLGTSVSTTATASMNSTLTGIIAASGTLTGSQTSATGTGETTPTSPVSVSATASSSAATAVRSSFSYTYLLLGGSLVASLLSQAV